MIRHVVVFRWQPGTTAAEVDRVRAGLAELRAAIGGIADYRYGADAGLAAEGAGNADFAITADFATVADYLVYRDHPRHQAFIAEVIRPIVAERHAVQMDVG